MSSDVVDRLKFALADRYTIEKELGRGGMATVYLAHDLRHQRKVAVKVLRPELALATSAKRFLREIRIAARLAHPHILPVLDSGEAEGFLYYVMPYVDGETLREQLDRSKRLSVDDTLRVGREIGDALTYAHSQNVLHRDIKPENILFQAGHAVLADFGIAKAVSRTTASSLTESGIVIGTPAYMSPEQASGDEAIDQRSDTYSLACVLYEMLAGEPPHAGATSRKIFAQRLMGELRPVTEVRSDVSPALDAVLNKALESALADRFSTPGDFLRALEAASTYQRTYGTKEASRVPRGLLQAGVAALLLTAGLVGWWLLAPDGQGSNVSATNPTRLSEWPFAVLPFDDLSSESETEHAGERVADALIGALSEVAGLRVISRTTARTINEDRLEAREIARQYNVYSIIDGTVTERDGQGVFTAHLIDALGDRTIWTRTYTRSPEETPEEIAALIVRDLRVSVLQRVIRPDGSNGGSSVLANPKLANTCVEQAPQLIWTVFELRSFDNSASSLPAVTRGSIDQCTIGPRQITLLPRFI